jgi:hypothetical protein
MGYETSGSNRLVYSHRQEDQRPPGQPRRDADPGQPFPHLVVARRLRSPTQRRYGTCVPPPSVGLYCRPDGMVHRNAPFGVFVFAFVKLSLVIQVVVLPELHLAAFPACRTWLEHPSPPFS